MFLIIHLRGQVTESHYFGGILGYGNTGMLQDEEQLGSWDPRTDHYFCPLSEAVKSSETNGSLCNLRLYFAFNFYGDSVVAAKPLCYVKHLTIVTESQIFFLLNNIYLKGCISEIKTWNAIANANSCSYYLIFIIPFVES